MKDHTEELGTTTLTMARLLSLNLYSFGTTVFTVNDGFENHH